MTAMWIFALAAQTPSPTPPNLVTPAPMEPPPANTGTMALWIAISVIVLLSAVAVMFVRRRRLAAEQQALDDTGG